MAVVRSELITMWLVVQHLYLTANEDTHIKIERKSRRDTPLSVKEYLKKIWVPSLVPVSCGTAKEKKSRNKQQNLFVSIQSFILFTNHHHHHHSLL